MRYRARGLWIFPHCCGESARNGTHKFVPSTVGPGVMALLDGSAPVMAATNGPRGPFMAIRGPRPKIA